MSLKALGGMSFLTTSVLVYMFKCCI